MARITGLARSTIYNGLSDVRDNVVAAPGRVRKSGGGRKKKTLGDLTLLRDLKALVEPTTRGDPMRALLWTYRSLRNLAKQLGKKGHKVCPTVVGNLLRGMGYSLQANSKTREGSNHIDRDAQFRYINDQAVDFLGADQPVISVDTKRKELVGNFKNSGREWRRKGEPERRPTCTTSSIPSWAGRSRMGSTTSTPMSDGLSVGTDHDTASFAVNAIRRWWSTMGRKRHAKAKRLMITADGGGSNGHRVRLWKVAASEVGGRANSRLPFAISRRRTSKWNKIEHRLFSFITINWRGKPLRSYRTIVQLIAATTTEAGLEVRAELDEKKYPKGVKVPDAQLAAVNLTRHAFHGDWNYTIAPRRTAK